MDNATMIAGFGIVKGLALAVIASALDLVFWKALVIAVISGAIGAAGAVVAAVIASRAAERNRVEIEHIKHKLNADRRSSDRAGEDNELDG